MISIINKIKKNYAKIVGAVIFLALWQIISWFIGMEMLFASPFQVAARLSDLIFEKDFLSTVFYSLLRIGIGFLIGFVLGLLLAVASGKKNWLNDLVSPLLVTVKSVPIASFIILFLIWFNYSYLAVLISFLIVFPIIYQNVFEGIKSADSKLLEVADFYKVGFRKKLIYVFIPNVKPYLISATKLAVGMAWKAGVAAEVIGQVDFSIGEKLYYSKIYVQNADLLSWTIVIIVLSALCEKVITKLLKLFFRKVEEL